MSFIVANGKNGKKIAATLVEYCVLALGGDRVNIWSQKGKKGQGRDGIYR